MEPRFFVCKDEVSFELLKAMASGEAGAEYDICAIPYDDGKIVLRLIPLTAFAAKFIGILLTAVQGLTRLPSPGEAQAFDDTQLKALPVAIRNKLPDGPNVDAFYAEVRREFPHEKSFREN